MLSKTTKMAGTLPAPSLTELAELGPMPGRQMTDDERRGFNWALGAMILWGTKIEREGIPLGGAEGDMVPLTQFMRHSGRMVRSCAEALHLTHGRRAA